jgi:hypothetical protein
MEMLGQTLEEPGAIGLAEVDRDISAEDNVKWFGVQFAWTPDWV